MCCNGVVFCIIRVVFLKIGHKSRLWGERYSIDPDSYETDYITGISKKVQSNAIVKAAKKWFLVDTISHGLSEVNLETGEVSLVVPFPDSITSGRMNALASFGYSNDDRLLLR